MKKYPAACLLAYLAALLVMATLDFVWLGFLATPLYQQGIGHLMSERPNIPAAVVFYFLYPVGLLLFAVHFQPTDATWKRASIVGAWFGFFAYATYDLTNLATLRNWPIGLSMIDVAWGTFISAVSAGAAKLAFKHVVERRT